MQPNPRTLRGVVFFGLIAMLAFGCSESNPDIDGDSDGETDGDMVDGDADGDALDEDGDTENDSDEEIDVDEEADELSIAVCDPGAGPFSLTIDNPYFPLPVGKHLVLEGNEGATLLRVEFSVLDETEIVAGVTTRVVEERETEDGELIEISRNYFAQAPDGTVCYFGEAVDDYDGGEIVGHGGAWRAGEDGNQPGIIMPAAPTVGMRYKQEVAPGVAEDRGEIVQMGESLTVPAGTFEDTLEVRETSPLDIGSSRKVYVRDIGMAVDGAIELIQY